MSKITYIDKVNNQSSALPPENKVQDADMNEIKTVVNANDDLHIALQNQVDDLEDRSGAVPFTFIFDSSTVEADPSAGKFRLDNALPSASSAVYISKTDQNIDASFLFSQLVSPNTIYFQSREVQKKGISVQVSTITDNPSWIKITYAVSSFSGDPFVDGETFQVFAFPSTGTGSVDYVPLVSDTGATITFTAYTEYNAATPLTTGGITIDPTGAQAGAYANVYYNGATEPTISGATTALTTGTFVANQLNIYHFFWNTDGKYVLNIQTVASALPQLSTPTIVAAAGDTLIDLTFSNIDANATTNVLERSTDNVNFSVVGGYNGTDLTYQDTSLTNGTEYFYRYKSQAAGYLDSAYATDSATPAAAGFAFNNCLLFDGVDDDVSFTKYGTGSPDTYSVSMWFRSEDITQIQGLISADNTNWYLRINQASNRFIYRSVGVNVFYDFLGMASTTWYHVVLSVSSGSGRMYLNGVESTSGAQAVTVGGAAGDNFGLLGTDFGGNPFDGRIDEVGLWYGYALTAGDVTTLYNSGNGANVSDVSPANLHFEYHLDESGSATTATDTSGAGNNGTLNNFPASGMWIDHNAP